jgi:hypothetical protein
MLLMSTTFGASGGERQVCIKAVDDMPLDMNSDR